MNVFHQSLWLLLGLCLLLCSPSLRAQTSPLSWQVESGAFLAGGDYAPFWLTANRHGLSSEKTASGYLAAGIFQTDRHPDRKFSYAYGLELVGAARFNAAFFVQQAYADLRYRRLELSIGSKERGSELKNNRLSSGGMIFSTNGRPVPQVRIGFPEFVPVPYTARWLHVKGHIAFGRFTDDGFQKEFVGSKSKYTEEALYHSKAFFLKLANEKTPLEAVIGFELASQFGGSCHYPGGRVIHTPHGLKDYLKVLLVHSGDEGYSESDQINKVGNHLGSFHLAAGYAFPTWKLRAYYEHPFEDESGIGFDYHAWRDALIGLEVTLPANRWVDTFVVEYLHTKHQSGAFHFFEKPTWGSNFTGADGYYNNSQYAGWEHWGQGLGNPLLTSPIYNDVPDLSFRNNRVLGYHAGLSGTPSAEWSYRMLLSYTRNWGTYSVPFDAVKKNLNGLLEVTYTPKKAKGWTFILGAAADKGSLLGDNVGGMFTVRKCGLIR